MPQLDVFAFNSLLYTSLFTLLLLYGVSDRIVLPQLLRVLKFRSERDQLQRNAADALLEETTLVLQGLQATQGAQLHAVDRTLRLALLTTYGAARVEAPAL
jgi:hypothetical protein